MRMESLAIDNKNDLRIFLKEKRKIISPSRKKQAREQAFTTLYAISLNYSSIASFMPMKREIDIQKFNLKLLQEGKLILPKVIGNDLQFFKILHFWGLQQSSLGVFEPSPDYYQPVPASSIELILVPGLGFDKMHHRIGYGKGFYDRYLSQFFGHTIGIGFQEQFLSKLLIPDQHDIALDKILLF